MSSAWLARGCHRASVWALMCAACLGELRAAPPAFLSGRESIDADAQPNRSFGQGRLDCLTVMQERRAQLLELWQTALAPEVALQLSGTKQQNPGQVGGHARVSVNLWRPACVLQLGQMQRQAGREQLVCQLSPTACHIDASEHFQTDTPNAAPNPARQVQSLTRRLWH